jgi:nucleoside-diphosphate-sugar epimerase
MRVLVTGHRGYIGAVLVPILASEGYEVFGLDSDYYAHCDFGPVAPEVPTLKKDIRDVDLADLEGIEAIVHLAALSDDPLANLDPELTYAINHAASVHMAKLAKQAGVSRFLFSSSCSTYGAAGEDMLSEEAEFNPLTPYGRSKVMVERDLGPLADDDFSPVYLRNATAYGVSPRLRFGLVLHDLAALAHLEGLVLLKSDGTPWRPLIHVEDICRAFVAALKAPREAIHNQAFNVGINEENYKIRELAEVVRDIVPDCRIEYAPDAGPDKRTYRVNFGKIGKMLPAFKPQWNVRRGVEQLYQAYQTVGMTAEDYRGPKFKRIDQIKRLLGEGNLDSSLRWTGKVTVD